MSEATAETFRQTACRVQYLQQTEGGAVTNKRATAVYRLDKKKKTKQGKQQQSRGEMTDQLLWLN